MKIYHPYKSFKEGKKFYIITKDGKKVHFGDSNYEHFTITPHYRSHSDWNKQQAYVARHKKNEDWNDPDNAAYWAYNYLWRFPTYYEAQDKIENDLRNRGYL